MTYLRIMKGVRFYLLLNSPSPMKQNVVTVHSTVRFQLWLQKIPAGEVT